MSTKPRPDRGAALAGAGITWRGFLLPMALLVVFALVALLAHLPVRPRTALGPREQPIAAPFHDGVAGSGRRVKEHPPLSAESNAQVRRDEAAR